MKKTLSQEDKDLVAEWKRCLASNQPLSRDEVAVDVERLKGLFDFYLERKAEKDLCSTRRFAEFSLEHALSQIFSPKQKELFKKKLEGRPLSKTEQEYYSRTVKKKVVALANFELHRLAKKLLGL